MNPSPEAQALIGELQRLCAQWLDPHIERIRVGDYQPRPKVINDAIWGSIHLHAWEVALLDSQLLQRLRFLRQLGVAHWLYPGAGHSRMEHSLGVLHQMQALLSALERSSSRADEPLFTDVVGKLLRIAALVHDCGHAVMSHVSEEFIADKPGVADLRTFLWKSHGARKKPSVSEAFAVVFVESLSFQKLIELPRVGADFIKDVPRACRAIAGFVLGAPVVPERAFLSLLMSGATDADKLDYMPRDSVMAGVPTPVDVRRVIEKLRVLDVPSSRLHPDYTRWAKVETDRVKVLALTSSGARALVELAMGRTVLYDKIYHHHKVRALEVMVRRALRAWPNQSVSEWLAMVDDDLIANRHRFDAIRCRTLLKRALVLPAPDEDSTPVDEQRWRRLTGPADSKGTHTHLDALQRELVGEAAKVAELLNVGVESLKQQAPELDRTDAKKLSLDEWAYVGDSGEELQRATVSAAGQRPEAGKHAARQLIHVFAPEGAILPVFIAARKLLVSNHGFTIGPDSYRATRLDPETIRRAEEDLVKQGYLTAESSGAEEQARIVSHREEGLETFLRIAWPRFVDLALAFGQYQSANGIAIGPGRIAAYLRQFQTEARARAALRMLEAVDVIGRRGLAAALESHLSQRDDYASVSSLGGPGDSSAFISYLMNDVPAGIRRKVRDLELALDEQTPGAILLWDDFCGKGRHTITVLAQWLGVSDDEVLDERLVEPLSTARAAAFRQRPIVIAFAMSRPSGKEAIEDFLARQGLSNIVVSPQAKVVDERNDVFETESVIPDKAARADLREFCQGVARRLFAPNRDRQERPWSDEQIESRLLGYGNEAHLIVFPYNVPTATLTVLWYSGTNWTPLFSRRTKPSQMRA